MPIKPVILWTDFLIYILVIASLLFFLWARGKQHIVQGWRRVMNRRLALISLILLTTFLYIGILDSIHFRPALKGNGLNGEVHYSTKVKSLFDVLISPLGQKFEKTYSAPFATTLYVKETIENADGTISRTFPKLKYAGQDLKNTKFIDITYRLFKALLASVLFLCVYGGLLVIILAFKNKQTFRQTSLDFLYQRLAINWRLIIATTFVVTFVAFVLAYLSQEYHVFGTNKVGQDVLYQTLKSIRTGLVIGTLTTLIMLPFAILMGIAAGFFGGRIDDVIQYLYTTLSSIPGVLLIAASILSLQIYIANHSELFTTFADRSDLRLLVLCIILGVTSWTGLCRMLRGETLKLRESDHISAAVALGTNRFVILIRHILPNVMHIVLIAVVLDFSLLVLAEAVLSYVGVGVDPSAISWGNMINSARLELAREPIVWWPLLAAFIFMFILVLSANLFADAVRDGFDPRAKHYD